MDKPWATVLELAAGMVKYQSVFTDPTVAVEDLTRGIHPRLTILEFANREILNGPTTNAPSDTASEDVSQDRAACFARNDMKFAKS
jgi:hypothetical protein